MSESLESVVSVKKEERIDTVEAVLEFDVKLKYPNVISSPEQ
jgi:hypothetical protein